MLATINKISALAGIFGFLAVVFIFELMKPEKIGFNRSRNSGRYRVSSSRFGRLYNRTIGKTWTDNTLDTLALIFGIDVPLLEQNIVLAGMDGYTSSVEIIVLKVLAFPVGIVIGAAAYFSGELTYGLFAFAAFVAMYFLPQDRVKEKVKKKTDGLLEELPEFIEQVYAYLVSGLDLRQSLLSVSEIAGGEMSDILNNVFANASVARPWDEELAETARKLGIEPFEDFVHNIIVAKNMGTDIVETLRKEVENINKANAARIKEKTRSLNAKLTAPILLFFVIPTMIIMIFPAFLEVMIGLS